MSEKRCFGCMRLKQGVPVCEHCGYDERRPNGPHQLSPGTMLNDQYVVGRVLGQGGFGITYMGWDQFLGIPVAIKEFYPSGVVIRDSTRSSSVFLTSDKVSDRFVANRDRFVREATSLAKLGRSSGTGSIVSIHNLVRANATAYIIMEYVDGIDLRSYMRRKGGVLTLEETLRLLLPLMESLEIVHNHHIVHRDISPDNIMVLPDGSTKLIDFGAAHEVQQNDEKSTEAILKFGFAPPEQYQRKGALGPWTDVYALCATIYYCTTGKLPPNATDRLLGSEDFHWDAIPGISGAMIQVLKKGTAVSKDKRTQTMGELRQALEKSMRARKTAPLHKLKKLGKPPAKKPEPPAQKPQPENAPAPVAKTEPLAATVPLKTDKSPAKESPKPEAKAETPILAEKPKAIVEKTSKPAKRPEKPAKEPKKSTEKQESPKAPAEQKKPAHRGKVLAIAALAMVAAAAAGILLTRTPKENTTLSQPPAATQATVEATVPSTPATEPVTEPAAEPPTEPTVDPSLWMDNVLMPTFNADFPLDTYESQMQYWGRTIYQSNICNNQVRSVTFLDTLADEPEDSWDVSAARDGSVKAWAQPNGELYDLYIAAEGGINGAQATRKMFFMFHKLEEVHFGRAFHTDEATDMSHMFSDCYRLNRLDLSSFKTARVTDMERMFSYCGSLHSLDLRNFDTSNVTNMEGMFGVRNDESKLTELDVSSFDTSKVTNMVSMFDGCYNLTKLDVSGFDTSNITDTTWMFANCESLTELDVSNFDTSNITCMDCMFAGCTSLTKLDVTNFDTSNVTEMTGIFLDCSSLTSLDLSNFNTANVMSMNGMFQGCTSLTTLNLSNFETPKLVFAGEMFRDCSNLTQLDISNLNTSKVTDMSAMFSGCSALTTLDLSNLNTAKVTDMNAMFSGCSALTTLDLSGFTFLQSVDKQDMFLNCTNLTDTNHPDFNRYLP